MGTVEVFPNPSPVRDLMALTDDDFARSFEYPLDAGIARYVQLLRVAGIETFESCDGTDGHAFPEPTVRFHGGRPEGWRALAVAQLHGLPVLALRRSWPIDDGEPTGPWWEMVFSQPRH